MWRPDGKGFYYVAYQPNASQLCEYDLELKRSSELTRISGELVIRFRDLTSGSVNGLYQAICLTDNVFTHGGSDILCIQARLSGNRFAAEAPRLAAIYANAAYYLGNHNRNGFLSEAFRIRNLGLLRGIVDRCETAVVDPVTGAWPKMPPVSLPLFILMALQEDKLWHPNVVERGVEVFHSDGLVTRLRLVTACCGKRLFGCSTMCMGE